MIDTAQYLVSGLSSGLIYALVALGWVLIYNLTGILNLAQGQFAMIGGLLFAWLADHHNWPMGLAIVTALLVAVVVGVVMDRLVLQWIHPEQHVVAIIVTAAASIVLEEAVRLSTTADPISTQPLISGSPLSFFGVTIARQAIILWACSIALAVALAVFFRRSLFGKAMLAYQQSPIGAACVGIRGSRVRIMAFGLAALIGAVGGVLLVPLTGMSYGTGTTIGIAGFVAAVVGGMGSYMGAVLGGILFGVLQALIAGFISSAFADAAAYALLIAVLILRPNGLLRSSTLRAVRV